MNSAVAHPIANRNRTALALGLTAAILLGLLCGYLPLKYFLALIAGLAFSAWLLIRPQDFWMLTVAALGLSVEKPVGGGTNIVILTEVLLLPVVCAYLLRFLMSGHVKVIKSSLTFPLLAYMAAIALTFITTLFPATTYKSGARDLAYAILGFFITPLVLTSRHRFRVFLSLALFFNTVLLLYGMYTQFKGGLAVYKAIAVPFFRDHGIYAAFISFFFAFLMAFWFERHPRRMMMPYRLLLVLTGASILFSFVRGAWLAIFAVFVFFGYRYRNRFSFKTLLIFTFLLALGSIAILSLDVTDIFTERITSAGDRETDVNMDRMDRWLTAWLIIEDHPLVGVGWGGYPDAYPSYSRFPTSFQSGHHMGSHNLYLEILSDAGIVGLSAFIWLLYTFFREGGRIFYGTQDPFIRAIAAGAVAAMLTILVHGFVNNLGPSDKIGLGFFTLIGLLPPLRRLMETDERNGKPSPAREQPAD